MCGIAGVYQFGETHEINQSTINSMTRHLDHRGPDSQGTWCDESVGLYLGHARLAILDLSPAGHQPMESKSGRYVIVYNGEIYNYRDIAEDLVAKVGVDFSGHSDTEVILEAIEFYGLFGAIEKFVGMFAFAVWDRHQRKLHLIRDRIGIKPIYFYSSGPVFAFSSELKPLESLPGFDRSIDSEAVLSLVEASYIRSPLSVYQKVRKLPPGCSLSVDFSSGELPRLGPPTPYWDMDQSIQKSLSSPYSGSLEDVADCLEEVITDAIRLRLISDVPLGSFLSGGIDSSLVVALMQKISSNPVKTFSIGFDEKQYNEAVFAKGVAQHLGTDHTELMVSPRMALDLVPSLGQIYDEPFADVSQIPTLLVSKLARQHVTVVLTGDGGDELFGGYERYLTGPRLLKKMQVLPRPVRVAVFECLRRISPKWRDRFLHLFHAVIPKVGYLTAERLDKLISLLPVHSMPELYRTLTQRDFRTALVQQETSLLPGGELEGFLQFPTQSPEAMMIQDAKSYLPDDVLAKVDRASMNHSLEVRVPLLDHRVFESAWKTPLEYKVNRDQGKIILKKILARHVPDRYFERPKMGFGVPIGSWLRSDLREWADDMLDHRSLASSGIFNQKVIGEKWRQHKNSEGNWQAYLWPVLMYQQWANQRS